MKIVTSRFKRPFFREMAFLTRSVSLVCLLALSSTAALATGPVGTASGFEDDDGDLAVGALFDWNGFASGADPDWTPPPAAPYREAESVMQGWDFKGIEDAQVTTSDTAFAGGVKQDDNCPKLKDGKAPNKDDLKRIYLSTKNVGGSTYLNLAWVRIPQNSTSASAHVGFEFNQGEVGCANSDLVNRVVGDVLFVYDFEGGNIPPTITMRRWIDADFATDDDQNGNNTGTAFFTDAASPCDIDSDSPPCWGDARDLTSLGFAEAEVNRGIAGTIPDDIAPDGTDNLADSEFGEAGIDLTGAGVFPEGQCTSFGTVFGVSRSSGSSGTAQMKDLVGPGDFTLSNCATVTIRKQTDPDGDTTTDFTFSTSIERDNGQSVANFNLKDDGVNVITLVDPGTYAVTESDPSPGYRLTDITCTGLTLDDDDLGGDDDVDESTRTVNFTIAAGESLDCTFYNAKNPIIKYEKITVGGDGQTGFDFVGTNGVGNDTLTPTGDGDANKDVSANYTVSDVTTDVTINETLPGGWEFTSAICQTATSGQLATVNEATETATISAANLAANSGKTITCTFTNTKLGDVTVTKAVVNNCAVDSGSFTLEIRETNAGGSLLKTATGGDGTTTTKSDLSAGTYWTGELANSAYTATASGACGSVPLAAGGSNSCTITNVRKPTVTIIKKVADGSTWDLLVDDGGDGFDEEALAKANGGSIGPITISTIESGSGINTVYGPVVLAEEAADGADKALDGLGDYNAYWRCNNSLGSTNSFDDTDSITIDQLQPGENITCTVTNIPTAGAACITP
ncbi:hypothetical protein GCM10011352_30430 [Marinobacterium zhoushanense]|uniref:Uncharacterized protein n=1 Tax=Marinobacterium zhoushanense TaxID=1679163 RepID=A0ABQ1KPC9_9GAMM|nr:hypothetical protein [Marinobacterium zhoushanense]GGC02153.1 hypothetical protein GCM10011352_30430 [Marinobacterium zhoushanense]